MDGFRGETVEGATCSEALGCRATKYGARKRWAVKKGRKRRKGRKKMHLPLGLCPIMLELLGEK